MLLLSDGLVIVIIGLFDELGLLVHLSVEWLDIAGVVTDPVGHSIGKRLVLPLCVSSLILIVLFHCLCNVTLNFVVEILQICLVSQKGDFVRTLVAIY